MGNPCPLARITATLVVQKYYIAAHLPSLERESFPPFRAPMVDNFPPLPRNKLTFSSAPKIQKSVCVVKHLFAPVCIFRHPRLAITFTFITFAEMKVKDYRRTRERTIVCTPVLLTPVTPKNKKYEKECLAAHCSLCHPRG